MMEPWQDVHEETFGSFKVFELRKVRRRSPRTGRELDFFVIHTRDWVNVLPFTEDGRLVMVRQFRHGPGRFTLEIPGGIFDGQEDPADAAARELREETGHGFRELHYVGRVNPNPALFTNTCYTYLALGCSKVGELQQDPGEDIEVVTVGEAEADDLAVSGAVDHALVLAAFYWQRLVREGRLRTRPVRPNQGN
jgi:ADP-ribose pyrophosphatase